jgi:hypothetical protein
MGIAKVHQDPAEVNVAIGSSRLRAGFVAGALALLLVQCSDDHGTLPSRPDQEAFIVIHLNPSEGPITWELGPDVWPVRFAPPLSWTAELVSPVNAWKLDLEVRLLEASSSTTCFVSSVSLDEPSQGFTYALDGAPFRLPEGATWFRNPCGNDFTIGTVEVVLMYGHTIGGDRGGEILKTVRVPCQYRVARTGYPGGPPSN